MDLSKIFIKNAKPTKVGGQAVLGGVMMKGYTKIALAMRLPDDSIYGTVTNMKRKSKWNKFPIIRGIAIFISSLVDGVKTIMRSADILEKYEDENASEDDWFTRWLNKKVGKDKAWTIMVYVSVVSSLFFSIVIFILLPTVLVNICNLIWDNHIFLNLVEGLLRIAIFLIYVVLVSKVKEIKEVFKYHGAEHKTIHCFENDKELTVENCRSFTRLHPRCGTSFLVFVLIISLIVFSFCGWPNLFWRIASRLLLLPVVAGISYELLRWAGKSDTWVVKILSLPGIYLQKITTAEPDAEHLEVAIISLKIAIKENDFEGEGICDDEGNIIKNVKALIALGEAKLLAVGIEEREAKVQSEMLYCHIKSIGRGDLFKHWNDPVNVAELKTYFNYIERKAIGEPLQYIVGHQEFMGLDFEVDENVLIPRLDTEVVVAKAKEILGSGNNIKLLDLCCGSGAIGISLAKSQNVDLVLADISMGALSVASKNATKNGVSADFVQGNLFENISSRFDMIISNPPYIPAGDLESLMKEVKEYEPRIALDGGLDGLDFYRRIVAEASTYLEEKGYLVMEIGHGQGEDVKKILESHQGFETIEIIFDLDNKERGVVARL